MKTLCILTYERTGSGWLSSVFDVQNTISLHELFSDDPLLWMSKCYKILAKIYNVDTELMNFLLSVYHYNNFFIDTNNYNNIKNNILKKNIYNQSILKLFINICKKNNYNLVFKLFPQHLKYISIDFLYDNIDYIILNYRQDLIKNYYSLEKAMATGVWFSDQKNRQNTNNNTEIKWDETKYNIYVNQTIKNIELLMNIYKNFNKTKCIISYEQIHEKEFLNNKEKIEFLQTILHIENLSLPVQNNEYFLKQNDKLQFSNYFDFNKSIESNRLKKKICL